MKILLQMKSLLILTILSIGCISCGRDANKRTLTLQFQLNFNGKPMQLGNKRYQLPNGQGEISINDFKFFVSNVQLHNMKNKRVQAVASSYHLVSFSDGKNMANFQIDSLEVEEVHGITFGLGVDRDQNLSIIPKGDLDPNGPMAWNWEEGYKFLLLEGFYYNHNQKQPLIYHIGFSENYQPLRFDYNPQRKSNDQEVINFDVELTALFNHPNPISPDTLRTVTFNRRHAKSIRENYRYMLSLTN